MTNIELITGADTQTIADWIAKHLAQELASHDAKAAICVPGGSTPFPIFAALLTRDLDWSRLEIWPGDDRIVAEDHAASNTGKIRSLFEPTGAQIIALKEGAAPPHFALTWLGMGADGHIASLFPNSNPAVDDPQSIRRLTPDPLPPEAPFDRITLTIPALLNSDAIMFTLGGSDEKRSVLNAAFAGSHDLPVARLLSAASGPVTCFT